MTCVPAEHEITWAVYKAVTTKSRSGQSPMVQIAICNRRLLLAWPRPVGNSNPPCEIDSPSFTVSVACCVVNLFGNPPQLTLVIGKYVVQSACFAAIMGQQRFGAPFSHC